MVHRPLVLLLILFGSGILFSHRLLANTAFTLPALVCCGLSLAALPFVPSRFRIVPVFFLFFVAGALVDLYHHRPSQLSAMAEKRQFVTIQGTVLEPITYRPELSRLVLQGHRVFSGTKVRTLDEKIRLSVVNHCPELSPGDQIRFPARLRVFRNFQNPGSFDYAGTMKQKGFACAASLSDGRRIVPMGPGVLPFPHNLAERARKPVRQFLQAHLEPPDDALFRALILGERQGITDEVREPFNQTGLGHVLAVSGLHIGLVAAISFFALKWLLNRSYRLALRWDVRKIAALLTCLSVIAYTALAGFQVSSQRAMIMALAFLASLILGREKDLWSTLALAALVILAVDPHALFSISFQLSFGAVIGILCLTPPILDRILRSRSDIPAQKTLARRLISYFLGLVVVSFAATLILMPLSALYFHRLPLVTLAANVTVVPIMGFWVLPLGLLSATLLPISVHLASFLLQAASWGLDGMMVLTRFFAHLPFASVWVVTPNAFEIALLYAILPLALLYGRRRWARIGLLCVVLTIAGDVAYWVHRVRFHQDLRVTYLDVGQGNAALVEFPRGKKMLIDGGGFPWGNFDVGRMVVAPFLWHSKILKVDYLVLSHPHPDHMNGMRFIASAFHPEEFWYNGIHVNTEAFIELLEIIDARGIQRILPRDLWTGRSIQGASLSLFHPEAGAHAPGTFGNPEELNDQSLVLKITYGKTSFLFPGDLERSGEAEVVARAGGLLRSDVLLSPHHGSRTSSTTAFLDRVRPQVCVVSAGADNFYGFPHSDVLKRLNRIGCGVYRTDQHGAVQCSAGSRGLAIRTFLDAENGRTVYQPRGM
jgi:competence protein ComEC